MGKRLFTLLVVLMTMTASATAIPAKRGQWRILTLADGRQVRVQLTGDEHLHYWTDAQGTAYQVSTAGTASLITDLPAQQAKARARRAQANKARRARRQAIASKADHHYTGTKKGIIILAQFKDKKFAAADNLAFYKRLANEEGFSEGNFKGSVSDYFKAQSGGDFRLDFDVVGPVTLSQTAAYYGNDVGGAGNDAHAEEMVMEACRAADSQVNFADYDWDGDGIADQVFVIYAGLGQANGGDASTVWPHEWQLSAATGSTLTLDNTAIDTYACGAELQPTEYGFDGNGNFGVTATQPDGIGTICHEFSHCLGFPDMYDTSSTGDNFGMGPWDLMDYGSYNDDGFQPAGYTSYEKMTAGWLTPIELGDADQRITGMEALSKGGDAYIIYNSANRNEYYLLENRQLTGWDASLYGAGLLVVHVDYDERVWEENSVNNERNRQRMTIIPADNSATYYDTNGYFSNSQLAGDPFPYQGNDSLTNNSKPAAKLYRTNTDGTKYLNRGITDITQHDDGTISFNYKSVSTTSGGSGSTLPAGTVIMHETFDKCSGKGGNDGLWSGNSTGSGAFVPDLTGWEAAKPYGADRCARFGTTKAAGVALSPYFTLDGTATLTLRVAPWATDDTTLGVHLVRANDSSQSDGTLINHYTMTAGQWNEYTETIEGDGDTYYLAFYPAKRFFLDDVSVYIPKTTDIPNIHTTAGQKPTGRIYSIDGRYLGTRLQGLPHGVYIMDGKKIVK